MADPIGLIRSTGGAGGFSPVAAPGVGRAPGGGQPTDPGAPSFKDALLQNIQHVNQLQQDATSAIEDLQSGKRTDVEGVLLATQKADTAFKMLLQVRNKVMEAYDEVKQIRT